MALWGYKCIFLFVRDRPHALLHARSRHFPPCGQSPVRVPSASCVNHRLQRVEKTKHRCEGEKMSERRKVVQAHKPEERTLRACSKHATPVYFPFHMRCACQGHKHPRRGLLYGRWKLRAMPSFSL